MFPKAVSISSMASLAPWKSWALSRPPVQTLLEMARADWIIVMTMTMIDIVRSSSKIVKPLFFISEELVQIGWRRV